MQIALSPLRFTMFRTGSVAGLDIYAHQLIDLASAVPTYGRRTARIWTRKVLYSDIWRKNKASLELPEVGDETYDEVMPELFSVCEEEYGFQHKDERVCKAMFQVCALQLLHSCHRNSSLRRILSKSLGYCSARKISMWRTWSILRFSRYLCFSLHLC